MIFLFSLTLTVVLCGLLSPLARRTGWVDSPDHRKRHTGDIPLVGGPAIVLAVSAVMLWMVWMNRCWKTRRFLGRQVS